MSQKWTSRERPFRIADVDPGGTGTCDVAIRQGEQPFRVTSVVADADGFRLVQCLAGRRSLVRKPVPFPATGLFGTVEAGQIVTVVVQNVSDEKKSFSGKLVGEELVRS